MARRNVFHGKSVRFTRGTSNSNHIPRRNDLDTYADDLAELVKTLDLEDAIHIGHSTGGGEVARYIGRHDTKRVAKAVLISAIPPLIVKTATNPEGTPTELFVQLRVAVAADRSQFLKEFCLAFLGYNRRVPKSRKECMTHSGFRGLWLVFPEPTFVSKHFSKRT